jgi:glycosyltransferase involved in cell wall biosynthesis
MESMLETIKYSFVLPAYKAKYFKEAIDSILNQTYVNFELVIVNDASPEDLDSIVDSYEDKRIRYYKNEQNVGGKDLVAQWNHSITYARGKYLILASDDDVYSPLYLEKMDALVDKYPNVNVFRPRVKRINNKGDIVRIEGYQPEYLTKLEYLYAWTNLWIGSGVPFYIFKREALLAIGGFASYPLAWFSDDATVLRLMDPGIVTCNMTLFTFRLSTESISTTQNSKVSLSAKLKATKMFCEEHNKIIGDYIPQSKEDVHLLSQIKKFFPRMIRKNKVRSQMKISSLATIISTIGDAVKIDGVSFFYILRCCKYPILNSLKRLVVCKK